jgi:uncharacterized protein DUF4440
MTKLASILVVGGLAFCTLFPKPLGTNSAVPQGDTPFSRELVSEVVSNERAVWEAAKEKNMERFASLVGEDARMIFTSGVVSRSEYMRSIADRNITSYSLRNFQVLTPAKGTTIVVYEATMTGVFRGRPVSSFSVREASVWVKRSGRWIAVLNQETPIS